MKPRTTKPAPTFFQVGDKPNYDPGTGQIISRVEGSPYIPKGKASRARKPGSAPQAATRPKNPRKREKPNYDPGTGQILSSVPGSPYIPKGIASTHPATPDAASAVPRPKRRRPPGSA